jgi:hypothetical protein
MKTEFDTLVVDIPSARNSAKGPGNGGACRADQGPIHSKELDDQVEALKATGVNIVFSDKISDTKTGRPNLIKLMRMLERGDLQVGSIRS